MNIICFHIFRFSPGYSSFCIPPPAHVSILCTAMFQRSKVSHLIDVFYSIVLLKIAFSFHYFTVASSLLVVVFFLHHSFNLYSNFGSFKIFGRFEICFYVFEIASFEIFISLLQNLQNYPLFFWLLIELLNTYFITQLLWQVVVS